MFSPLNFPAERLPDWLARPRGPADPGDGRGHARHLAPEAFPLTPGAFAMLAAWAGASFAVTWRILARRG